MKSRLFGDKVDEAFAWEGWRLCGVSPHDGHPDIFDEWSFRHTGGDRFTIVSLKGGLGVRLARDRLFAYMTSQLRCAMLTMTVGTDG